MEKRHQAVPRDALAALRAFIPDLPDRPGRELSRILGLKEIIKLSFNESPYGPSPLAVDAMRTAAAGVHLYHDADAADLRDKLAAMYEVSPDMVWLGNGGDEVLALLAHAYLEPGDDSIIPQPTFGQYAKATQLMGAVPVRVPVDENLAVDLEAMLCAISPRTRIIFLCNPNNPTGHMITGDVLRRFVAAVPAHVLVVLDEAYAEYVDRPDFLSGLDLVAEFNHVVTVRTFSKVYGMAGARLGYGVAHPAVVANIQKVRPTFNTNAVALAGGSAALEDPAFRDYVARMNNSERERMTEALASLGCRVYPSQTNFLMVDTRLDSVQLCLALARRGIVIRPGSGWNLPTHVRISLGNMEQNDRLLEELSHLL